MSKARGLVKVCYKADYLIDTAVRTIKTIAPINSSLLYDVQDHGFPISDGLDKCYRLFMVLARESGIRYNLVSFMPFTILDPSGPAGQYSIGIFNESSFTGGVDLDKTSMITVSESPLQCQCGKEKHGFASHSQWCPKYE